MTPFVFSVAQEMAGNDIPAKGTASAVFTKSLRFIINYKGSIPVGFLSGESEYWLVGHPGAIGKVREGDWVATGCDRGFR